MSMMATSVDPNPPEVIPAPAWHRSRGEMGRWVRLALVCSLLLISGGVRLWQAGKVEAVLQEGRVSPFPLEQVPRVLGDWRGEDTKIDSKIARRTGATDLVTRRYVDQRTGASIELILLYGPTTEVFNHVPELCYKAAGYSKKAGPDVREIEVDSHALPFRSLVYTKGEGGQAEFHEVFYSWRFTNHWSPEIEGTFKRFERIPGLLKVHLARKVSDQERRDIGNPCEDLLRVLLPELESRLALTMPLPARPNGGDRE